jgi:hypothetical protein
MRMYPLCVCVFAVISSLKFRVEIKYNFVLPDFSH